MKKLYTLLGMIGLIAFSTTSIAQCPNDNAQFGTTNAPTASNNNITMTTCIFGGEYRLVTNMQAGSSYTFETCGDTDFDSEITVYNDGTGAFIVENDDFCGLQSRVTFTSDGSDVRVLVDQFPCNGNTTCMTLVASVAAGASDPCDNIATLVCDASSSLSLSGTGLFNNNGPWNTPGAEQIYEFTATASGSHTIDISFSGGGYIDLFSRNANTGCSGSGWLYIDDVLGSATNSVNLVAGQTYYFLLDDENTTSNTGSITINCPSGVDPCDDITDLDGCAVSKDFSLSGAGAFNGNGPYSTPGEEVIYSYTAPYSGDFEIGISHTGGFYVDLFVTEASNGCSGTGWTYIDDIFSSATNDVFLVGGTTYYFMIDDENLSATDGTITIACPCIPSTNVDGAYTYNGPFTINGSTNGECNDCSLRPSDDQIHSIEITCSGTYTFETCNLATWDTYLYLTDAFCGNVIALNDDACGLRSSITASLAPGVYFLSVEAFGASQGGDYGVAVSGVLDPIVANVTPQNHIIDCVPIPVDISASPTGGSGNYEYLWSDGSTGSSITVNPNVTTDYSVTVTDLSGCGTTTESTTVTVVNRCGNNNQKSLICHVPSGNPGNAHTICISPNALNAHLASLWNLHGGDYCGPCANSIGTITTDNTNLGDNSFIRAGMNANDESIEVSYRLAYDTDVRIEVYDMAGVLVDVIFEGNASEGQLYDLNLHTDKISSGVYIYQFITNRETHIDKFQIIQ